MEMGSGKTGAGPNRGWNLVRIAVAGLLLTASALKCYQLATEPTIGTSFLESRWLLMATVEFELFFGIWLLANIWAKPTWAAALACFGLFTCVSLCKAISGHASCGCFGRVPVNPWYTSMLDLAIVFSLLRWRPTLPSPYGRGAGGEGQLSTSSLPPGERKGEGGEAAVRLALRGTAVLIVWLAVGLPAAYAMGSYTDTTLSDAGEIIGNGKTVVLEPEKWVGKRFPLLDYIDIGDRLSEGKWFVLLYHHDCPDCQAAIPKYKRLAHDLSARGAAVQVALIEVPPCSNNSPERVSREGGYITGRLSSVRDWIATTPLQVNVNDTVVMRVSGGQNQMAAGASFQNKAGAVPHGI